MIDKKREEEEGKRLSKSTRPKKASEHERNMFVPAFMLFGCNAIMEHKFIFA